MFEVKFELVTWMIKKNCNYSAVAKKISRNTFLLMFT